MEKAFICLKVWHIIIFFGWIPKVSYYYVFTHTQYACMQRCLLVHIFYTLSFYSGEKGIGKNSYVEIQQTHLASGFYYRAHQ